MNRILIFLSFVVLLAACGTDSSSEQVQEDPGVVVSSDADLRMPLIVNIDYLRMRDAPGQDGAILKNLSHGDTLYDLGEVSSFTTRVKLRGIWFDEPWLRVETPTGEKGWVYGGGLHLGVHSMQVPAGSPVGRELMRKRLQTFFGKQLASSILKYKEAYGKLQNSAAFAENYHRGDELRDSIVQVLESRIEVPASDELPDLFWLEDAMPGFVAQLVAEGTEYYLFRNFKELGKKAKKTNGSEDDAFISLTYQIFPIDSIEYFFPSWIIQTADYEGHSELGKGVHYELLKQMNEILANSNLFAEEIEMYKQAIIQDITHPDNTYWFGQEAILEELDAIISADFGLLSKADQIALRARRKQFEKPEENGIQLNVRSGIYDS